MGLMSIVTSVPFLMFPRYLPDSYLVRKERIKEMAKTYSSLNNEEESLLVMIKMFPLQLKRVVLNFSFIFISLSTGGLFILTSGLVSFAPQFLEIQFYLTDTTAGLVAGGVGIIAASLFINNLNKLTAKSHYSWWRPVRCTHNLYF
jgi:organic anion transporter 4A